MWKKLTARFSNIFLNSAFMSLPGISNQLLSIVIIRFYNDTWWGQIVELQLVYYFVSSICAWGNKDYLLREFSKKPSGVLSLWQQSFNERSVFLLIPFIIILVFIYPFFVSVNLVCWILFQFVNQSIESLITFEKRFFTAFVSEISSLVFLCLALFIFRTNLSFELLVSFISIGYFVKNMVLTFSFRNYFQNIVKTKLQTGIIRDSFLFMLLGFSAVLSQKTDMVVLDFFMSKQDLAKYQVITIFILQVQTSAGLILYPFVKNIYRFGSEKIIQISNRLFLFGLIISVAGIFVQFLFLKYVYLYTTEYPVYLFSFLACLPVFFVAPLTYHLFRNNRQQDVLLLTFISILLNVLLSVILIKPFGINGALMAVVASQFASLLFTIYFFNKEKQGISS